MKTTEIMGITCVTENNTQNCSTDASVKRGGMGNSVKKNINIDEKRDESKTGNLGKSVQQQQQQQEKDKKMKMKSDTCTTKSTRNKSDEGKIILLPCSNCKNKTVVYSCSCKKVNMEI